MKKLYLLIFIGALFLITTCNKKQNIPVYKNENASIDERVKDIIARMTLKEKIAQLKYDAPSIKTDRLDIPAYNWWNECLHGVARAGEATVYPQAIGLAATFDTALIYRIATEISDEARAKYHYYINKGRYGQMYEGLTFWSPNINIFRDPRWGRGQETYGEDPFLTGSIAVSFIKGLQGNNPKYFKVIATSKHFAVHSGPESTRHKIDVNPSERDLWETYLPAFKMSIEKANVQSIMCAYNSFRGMPCCGSKPLIKDILYNRLKFKGYVVSDCWAISDFYHKNFHHIVETPQEAAGIALKSGTDLNCGVAYKYLQASLDSGYVTETDIDSALYKLFKTRIQLGMFDNQENVPYSKIPYSVVCSGKHNQTALEAAQKSIVLLKNENNLLPLNKNIKSLAVIGPNIKDFDVFYGNYNGYPRKRINLLTALRQKLPATQINAAFGTFLCDGLPPVDYIPPEYLCFGNDNKAGGLYAEYFKNDSCYGTPAFTRIDSTINFTWYSGSPLNNEVLDTFSVRWTGKILAPKTGKYKIAFKGKDKCTFQLGDSVIEFDNGWNYNQRIDFYMEKGKTYDLKIEYAAHSAKGQIHLMWYVPEDDLTEKAVAAAQKSEAVVLFLGLSTLLEEEQMELQVEGFDRGDRTLLRLPETQINLIKKVFATGKPVVLVLTGGSALAVNWSSKHLPAILDVWYPGQAGAEAIADVLFGDYNPAGRLPVTFYKSVNDLPPFDDYSMENRTYRYFTGEPLYEFGYGLSYTQFEYSGLQVEKQNDTLNISLKVKNTGKYSGDEVVQVYVKNLSTKHPQPIKSLKGFTRINIKQGESQTVNLQIAVKDLAYWDTDKNNFTVEKTQYEIQIGASSKDIRLKKKIVL